MLILLNKSDMVKHWFSVYLALKSWRTHFRTFSFLYMVTIKEYAFWIFPAEKALKRWFITPQIIYFFDISYTCKVLQYKIKRKTRILGRDTHIVQKVSKASIFQCTQQSEIPMEEERVDIHSHVTITGKSCIQSFIIR